MAKNRIKNKHSSPYWYYWNLLLCLVIVGAVGLIVHLVHQYTQSDADENGVISCRADHHCTISIHWHARIRAETCGTKIIFPIKKGELGQQHTHKERDLIHMHAALPYNPKTREILDYHPLRLGNFFENMGLTFSPQCLGLVCNGVVCPDGKKHHFTMTVNGEPTNAFDSYLWKDGDEIIIKTVPG